MAVGGGGSRTEVVVMSPVFPPWRGPARILGWPRVRFALTGALVTGVPLDLVIDGGRPWYLPRTSALATAALLAFGLFEHWPRRLPKPIARWAVQVLAVAAAIPLTTFPIWVISDPGPRPFWTSEDQLLNFSMVTLLGLLLAPWAALAALVRQKEALARHQALAFELERSELERQALDARLRLLQAQVAPHFLFNTLANVQALVDLGSPRASRVLRNLVAYLRAAVPRLDEGSTTLGQELELVRAYLELMHMRIPDRLEYTLHVGDGVGGLRCPPMTLLTLVENAVRHGVDPSEDGGRIDVDVRRRDGRCWVRVTDTGTGLHDARPGLGTGLSTLRDRLALSFAGDARLRLGENATRGACAEGDFPAEGAIA